MKGRIKKSENTAPVLEEIGTLSIGDKGTSKDGKEIPISLDYFRATGDYADEFHSVFGERPTRIPIVFLTDDIRQSCYERIEYRVGKKLYASGGYEDSRGGTSFDIYVKEKDQYQEFSTVDHPGIEKMIESKFPGGKWRTVLTLRFIIPEIRGIFGSWRFTTGAEKTSIMKIRSTFDLVQDKAGSIVNIPFDLTVQKVTSQKPDSKSSFPIVSLICNLSETSLERVRDMLENNNRLRGVLTDERIESESRQIEYIEPERVKTEEDSEG